MFEQFWVFEQFWASYPSRKGRPKVGKALCERLFKELSDEDQALAIQAAKAYAKASQPRADGSFVPDPRDPIRFLRADWWRDWLEAPAQQCQFRSVESCQQMAVEGSDVCKFHASYRRKIAQLRKVL
jgi:hypothetical protein